MLNIDMTLYLQRRVVASSGLLRHFVPRNDDTVVDAPYYQLFSYSVIQLLILTTQFPLMTM